MKQKLVIKMSMNNNTSKCCCFGRKNTRSKALEVVGGFEGVQSVALVDDQDQIEVTGDFDVVKLTNLLREKVGFAQLVTVSEADAKKEGDNEDKAAEPVIWSYAGGVPHHEIAYVVDRYPSYSEPSCLIM